MTKDDITVTCVDVMLLDEWFEWPVTHFVIIGTPPVEQTDDAAPESGEEEETK